MSAIDKAVDASRASAAETLRHWLWARFASLIRFALAVLLCQTPVTAVVVLGWLMRLMHREEAFARARLAGRHRIEPRPVLPNWIGGEGEAGGWLSRLCGSAVANVRHGLAAALTVFIGTAPFTVLWLLSWWGGWENSFNKGYEQAWVGPTIGLIGTAFALPLLAYQPMALAHQAAQGTVRAYFDFATVLRLIRSVIWRYLGLSILIVAAAVAVLVAKAAPVFIEHWRPGFMDRDSEAVQAFANSYKFWMSALVLALLMFVRRASARLHARATHNLTQQGQSRSWIGFGAGVLQVVLLMAIWFALVVQIYIGQFFNHHWFAWINVPILGLPWLPL